MINWFRRRTTSGAISKSSSGVSKELSVEEIIQKYKQGLTDTSIKPDDGLINSIKALTSISKLEPYDYLDLSNKLLTQFPSTLRGCKKLKILLLDFNKIAIIPS